MLSRQQQVHPREITNVSALIDTEKVIKYVVIDNKIVASDVIADPDFTKTVPAGVTAATGMDAITHAVESYISNMATPLTEYNSLKGLEILHKNLPKVVKDGSDMDAREQMILGMSRCRGSDSPMPISDWFTVLHIH